MRHLLAAIPHIHAGNKAFRGLANTLASSSWPFASFTIRQCIFTQAINRQAITAVALERHFIRHKKYPSTLQELVPEFLSSLPTDTLTGKPLGYRQTDDGRYTIWSFGFDGVDDGGKVNPSSNGNSSNLHQLDYKGDWTRQYQPVVP